MQFKKQQLKLDMGQQTGPKLEKEYVKAVYCHPAYLTYMQSESEVAQSCPTLCDPIDGSPPVSSVPGILQARTLEWVAISFPNVCHFLLQFAVIDISPSSLDSTLWFIQPSISHYVLCI